MTTAKEKAFWRRVDGLILRANDLEDQSVQRVLKLLTDTHRDIAATVATTDWQAYRLGEMKAAVERSMRQFGDQYGVELREAQRGLWEHGVEMVDQPLRVAGVTAAITEMDTAALAIMQDYGADLVTNVAADGTRRINNALTMGILGQKSPFDVMEEIGRSLNDKSIFKSIRDRAEAITRTEGGRVLEAASQARKQAAAAVVPGLQKRWFYGHSPKVPRLSHVAVHNQIRDVNEPFNVMGEALMYPKDPAGSAKNTIRCGCTSLPYMAEWFEGQEKPKRPGQKMVGGKIVDGGLGVNTPDEIHELIQARFSKFATHGNGISIGSVKHADWFMQTYSHAGIIDLSSRKFRHLNNLQPSEDLHNAFRKMGITPLSFNEEYCLESLWHEIMHNRQTQGALRYRKRHYRTVLMETVNQWVSRRTYGRMMSELGEYAPEWQEQIKKRGHGYGIWVGKLDRLLNRLGLGDEILVDIEKIHGNAEHYDYARPLAKLLAKKSGNWDQKDNIKACLKSIREYEFEEKLSRLSVKEVD